MNLGDPAVLCCLYYVGTDIQRVKPLPCDCCKHHVASSTMHHLLQMLVAASLQTPIVVFGRWCKYISYSIPYLQLGVLHYLYCTSSKLLLMLNNKFAVCVTVSNAGSSAKCDPSTAGFVKPESTQTLSMMAYIAIASSMSATMG